jgi:hypothetical protein
VPDGVNVLSDFMAARSRDAVTFAVLLRAWSRGMAKPSAQFDPAWPVKFRRHSRPATSKKGRGCENAAVAAQRRSAQGLFLFRRQGSQDRSGPDRLDQRPRAEHGDHRFRL